MQKYYILYVSVSILLFALPVQGQNWSWVQQWGTAQTEQVTSIESLIDGSLVVSGNYQQQLDIGNQLPIARENDIFLASLSAQGQSNWNLAGGSADDDAAVALATDASGNINWTGSFWDTLQLDFFLLPSPVSGRSLFVLQIDDQGNINWGEVIHGTGDKEVTDIEVSGDGDVYVSGHFTESLSIGDTLLNAVAERDIFLAKYDLDGNFIWATQLGKTGTHQAVSLAPMPDGGVVLGGYFEGSIVWPGGEMAVTTPDDDACLFRFHPDGSVAWGLRAGAQYQDRINAITTSPQGLVYIAGTFLGVLDFGGDFVLETVGFNDNIFLAAFSASGDAYWVHPIGETTQEMTLALEWHPDFKLLLSGLYEENLSIAPFSLISGSTALSSFVVSLDQTAVPQWVVGLSSTDNLLAQAVTATNSGQVFVGGTFAGQASFDEQPYPAEGQFDAFVGAINQQLTDIKKPVPSKPFIEVRPNPVRTNLFIESRYSDTHVQIFQPNGQQIWEGTTPVQLDMTRYPSGIYTVHGFSEIGMVRDSVNFYKD